MSIQELQAAAERLKGKGMPNGTGTLSMGQLIDLSSLARWAMMLLSTEPITEEWLRETWGECTSWDDGEAVNFMSHESLLEVSFIKDGEHPIVKKGDTVLGEFRTRGQFTALMFSLGQYPKEPRDA